MAKRKTSKPKKGADTPNLGTQALLDKLEEKGHLDELEEKTRRITALETELQKQNRIHKALEIKHENLITQSGIADAAGPPNLGPIKAKSPSKGTEATVVMVASDWHVEEIVEPEAVNSLNEYNSEISARRAKEFFRVGHRLAQVVANDMRVTTIVLPLLGDFITNHLHDDNPETNDKLPMEAIVQAQQYIGSGIRFLLDNTKCDIIIPCHSGNHGRTTKRVHSATEHGHSLEFFMYKNMELFFRREKRVTFHITTAYHSYLPVYDTVIRFHHGHAIRYHGGVGGIFIPTYKAIAQWNKARHADLDVFGHFHQMRDGGNFFSNGSLIGWSAYGVRIKADFERPQQTFFVIDSKRGLTWRAPILVDGGMN